MRQPVLIEQFKTYCESVFEGRNMLRYLKKKLITDPKMNTSDIQIAVDTETLYHM